MKKLILLSFLLVSTFVTFTNAQAVSDSTKTHQKHQKQNKTKVMPQPAAQRAVQYSQDLKAKLSGPCRAFVHRVPCRQSATGPSAHERSIGQRPGLPVRRQDPCWALVRREPTGELATTSPTLRQARASLHLPRVKSGNFTGALPLASDCSLSGPGTLQAAAS